MTRKRGTATRAALIASLAVAFGVGSSALATTPPSEPAGGGGECPRDIAAAAAAETTVPQTTAAPATTAAAAPATTAAAAARRPLLHRGPRRRRRRCLRTSPSSTPQATSNINAQPRESLQQGGTRATGRWARWPRTGTRSTQTATSSTSGEVARADELLRRSSSTPRATPTLNPDFVLEATETEDPFTRDVHAQPGGCLAQRRADHRRGLQANWEAHERPEPRVPGRVDGGVRT